MAEKTKTLSPEKLRFHCTIEIEDNVAIQKCIMISRLDGEDIWNGEKFLRPEDGPKFSELLDFLSAVEETIDPLTYHKLNKQ